VIDEPVVRILVEEGAAVPEYKSQGAAGADLRAFIPAPLELAPGARTAVPTGLRLELPEGYEAQVRPRSGLALEKGVTCLNSPGTIDADYRGEVMITLYTVAPDITHTVNHGDRIAQLVVGQLADVGFERAVTLSETARGAGGHGSTGR